MSILFQTSDINGMTPANLCLKPAHAGKGVPCLTAEREGAA